MTAVNAAPTCPAHMPVPSTRDTARDHDPRATHGAHHPNGSPGGGGAVTRASSPPRHHHRMAWPTHKTRAARYGREHRNTRAAHMAALRQAGAGLCAEVVCVKRSRVITPDMELDLAHDAATGKVLGLAHRVCNRHEAAVRGNRLRFHPTTAPRRQSQLRW